MRQSQVQLRLQVAQVFDLLDPFGLLALGELCPEFQKSRKPGRILLPGARRLRVEQILRVIGPRRSGLR